MSTPVPPDDVPPVPPEQSTAGNTPRPGRRRAWRWIAAGLLAGLAVVLLAFFWMRRQEQNARAASENNLRMMAVAISGYHDVYRTPPAEGYDKDGKPLLSWRVLILPWLEQTALFKEFHLDEPWDSPHNKQLLPRMPQVYAPTRGQPPQPGYTFYRMVANSGTLFDPRFRAGFRREIPDRSRAILLLEAGEAVPWTMPEDLACAPDRPLPPLGGVFRDGFMAWFYDGEARFVPRDTDEKTLRQYLGCESAVGPQARP